MRIDKFLKVSRILKRRSLGKEACESQSPGRTLFRRGQIILYSIFRRQEDTYEKVCINDLFIGFDPALWSTGLFRKFHIRHRDLQLFPIGKTSLPGQFHLRHGNFHL